MVLVNELKLLSSDFRVRSGREYLPFRIWDLLLRYDLGADINILVFCVSGLLLLGQDIPIRLSLVRGRFELLPQQ